MTRFDCNHTAHVIVLWQMQKFLWYCRVFALSYFEFEGNLRFQASGACIWRGDLSEDFLRYEFGGLYLEGLIFGILR